MVLVAVVLAALDAAGEVDVEAEVHFEGGGFVGVMQA